MSSLARAFRRASLPLAAYYVVTLALPVANGAARSGMPFAKHALVVIVIPLLAVALAGAMHAIHASCSRILKSDRPDRIDYPLTVSVPGGSQ